MAQDVYKRQVATLNKKLIVNSLQVVFDLLQRSNSKQMTNELSAYFMVAVYRAFRILYCANPKNPSGIFRAHPLLADGQASAAMQLFLSNASCIAAGESTGELEGLDDPALLAMKMCIRDRYGPWRLRGGVRI